MFEQVVQHNICLGVPPQFNDYAHTLAVRLVSNVRNALNLLFPDKLGNFFHQVGFVHLVG